MSRHKIARSLGVSVPALKAVPDHYQEEAYTILRAEFEARREIAGELDIPIHLVVLPEF